MAEFLSDAWFDALRAAAARAAPDPGLELVIEQVVRTDGGEQRRYQLRFGHGRLQVSSDASPPADVTLTADLDVARAISSGERSAQEAFITGELTIGGDLRKLLEAQPALAELGDVFAPTRLAHPGSTNESR